MNFFENIHETQITRGNKRPFRAFVPPHRRLFPLKNRNCPRSIARAAVLEVLG